MYVTASHPGFLSREKRWELTRFLRFPPAPADPIVSDQAQVWEGACSEGQIFLVDTITEVAHYEDFVL